MPATSSVSLSKAAGEDTHLGRDRDHHVQIEDRLTGPPPAPERETVLPERRAPLGAAPDRFLSPAARSVQRVPHRFAQRQPGQHHQPVERVGLPAAVPPDQYLQSPFGEPLRRALDLPLEDLANAVPAGAGV
ncbi:hypothetical protein GCM10019016_033220 [Streptomyces prasinosporus]|uniref:Uncharacterized protein n=1 Tax=Streptomyces prasinosporus TaxID=68256 RepID=A0ABP6TLS6_9ACTN